MVKATHFYMTFTLILWCALSGCGSGVCVFNANDEIVTHPCGADVYYAGGKAYSSAPLKGYSFQSRYSPGNTRAGEVTAMYGCTYELSNGWYGDAECAFVVSY